MPRYQNSWGGFVEVERDGTTVRWATGDQYRKARVREKTFDTEDQARYEAGKLVARSVGVTQPVGPSTLLGPVEPAPTPGSSILIDEYFAGGDDRFLDELFRSTSPKKLASVADRWIADTRPWARKMLLAYIADGCDRPFHKAVVKRLYKKFEAAGDDEVIAHFLVAFDGFERRVLITEYNVKKLVSDPLIPERLHDPKRHDDAFPQFTRATRRYLVRRAYRYFRLIGRVDAERYGRALRIALPLYRDETLATPARLLDAWGLLHALYRYSPAIIRTKNGVSLANGMGLGSLAPAPHYPAAWRGHFAELFAILVGSPARTVRTWVAQWLRAEYATELAKLDYAAVKSLLASAYDDLQAVGAERLKTLAGLETLPLTEWLELLAIENLDVLPAICEVVARNVAPVRLTLEQCVQLACARTAPVAQLGLDWAKAKTIAGPKDIATIIRLGKAGVPGVRDAGAQWAAATIAKHPAATPENLRDLVDAPHADAREHALAAVASTEKLATPALWFALTESPYADVREVVIANATKWRATAAKSTLAHVWASALLDVHRGAVAKRRVPREIADRIASHPAEARELLPLLRVALRSVRPAERTTAVAAIARAIATNPELRALATELIPELTIGDQVAL